MKAKVKARSIKRMEPPEIEGCEHERRMKVWDEARRLIEEGNRGSWPRDMIEAEFYELEAQLDLEIRTRNCAQDDFMKAEAHIEELEAQLASLREAMDTELVCCHIGTLDSMKSPKHAIAAIAKWHYDLGVSGVCERKAQEGES